MLKGIEAQIGKIGRLKVVINSKNTAHCFSKRTAQSAWRIALNSKFQFPNPRQISISNDQSFLFRISVIVVYLLLGAWNSLLFLSAMRCALCRILIVVAFRVFSVPIISCFNDRFQVGVSGNPSQLMSHLLRTGHQPGRVPWSPW